MAKSTSRRALPKRWAARPDQELILLNGGVIPIVSEDAQIRAVLEGLTVQNKLGGVVALQCERSPTEIPDERVTTLLIVTWAETIEAATQREEAPSTIPSATPKATPEMVGAGEVEELTAATEAYNAEIDAARSEDNPDGFDYEQLQAEDVEAEPEVAR